MPRMNPEQVRTLFNVTNHTLKYWRRLPADNPLHLPAIPDEGNQNVIWYDVDTVCEFIARNDRYRDRTLAMLAPKQAQDDFRPGPGLFSPPSTYNHTEDTQ